MADSDETRFSGSTTGGAAGGRVAGDRVAVIGTGAIGSAVTRRLLADGRDVTVWNRTAARTEQLVAVGATAAHSIGEAVSGSTLVLLTLTDYTAVRWCLTQLAGDLSGRTIVVMCTGTPADAEDAARQAASAGARYLDAGVQAAPEAIGTATATILYSGVRDAFDAHVEVLELLSTPRFVGTSAGAAAVWDLTLFGLWYDAQLGLLRALETVRAHGGDLAEFGTAATTQLGHVVSAVPATVAETLAGDYPRGPASLTEHLPVVRQLVDLRDGQRLGDGGLAVVARRIEAAITDGRGDEGLTATLA